MGKAGGSVMADDARRTYEQQLRLFELDVAQMVEAETEYVRTGKHRSVTMRNCVQQWEALARDARNLYNREDNSYGKKEYR
jgi:hypothetical protein